TEVSGVCDHWAEDDQDAIRIVRDIVKNLNRKRKVELATRPVVEPLFPSEEIYGVLPSDQRKPFDVREIIARIVDGSEFHEFKERYATTIVCGFAHIWGQPAG